MDLEELREYHSIDEVQIAIDGDTVTATANSIGAGYKSIFAYSELQEYIRHAINCSFYVIEGYEEGTIV